jgi:hypothetical protein
VNIGFFFVDKGGDDRHYARIMVDSAKACMPKVRVVQFTDQKTKAVKGVDEVRRKPSEPMALLRMRHHAGVTGNWVFVDTDVVFQRSVRKVFDEAGWDIGLTTRNWEHVSQAAGFSQRMPFNIGVVFSRAPRFWAEVYRRLLMMPAAQQEWMGDQEAVGDLVAENAEMRWFQIAHLKGSAYNYPPLIPDKKTEQERLTQAAIVHYKGAARKPMLLARRDGERACA